MKIGTRASLDVIRRGQTQQVSIDLIAAPDKPDRQETLLKGEQPLNGAVVINLSPATSDELGVGDWQGVAILKIRRGSYADQLGLQPGDILIKINGTDVHAVDDVVALTGQPADKWSLTVSRGGQTKIIQVR
jgi:serine protease Do